MADIELVAITHPVTGLVAQVPASTARVLVDGSGWQYVDDDTTGDAGGDGGDD